MAGAYVFPGGKLDPSDADADMLARLVPGAAEACAGRLTATPGTELEPNTAVGLHVAGCRETFEEAGVLLARNADGGWVDLADPARAARLAEARRALNAGEAKFAEILRSEDLFVDIEGLHYWAHWVTPSAEPRRFDTRFFIACLPPGQEAVSDGREAIDLVWHRPEVALEAHDQGSMFLPPPTLRSLSELAGFESIDAICEASQGRPIGAIMPKLLAEDGQLTIVLPWDPEYDKIEGEALPGPAPQDPCPHLPSRIGLVLSPGATF